MLNIKKIIIISLLVLVAIFGGRAIYNYSQYGDIRGKKYAEKNNDYSEKIEEEKEKHLLEKWGNIHPDFKSNPELINEWTKRNLVYEDAKEWIEAGIKPWQAEFVIWLLNVEDIEGNVFVEPSWISQNDRKQQMWAEWKEERLKTAPNFKNISYIRAVLKRDCQRQIFAGEKDCIEVLEFTERSEYEKFLRKKGENWEYYKLWQAYLKRWLELEEMMQKVKIPLIIKEKFTDEAKNELTKLVDGETDAYFKIEDERVVIPLQIKKFVRNNYRQKWERKGREYAAYTIKTPTITILWKGRKEIKITDLAIVWKDKNNEISDIDDILREGAEIKLKLGKNLEESEEPMNEWHLKEEGDWKEGGNNTFSLEVFSNYEIITPNRKIKFN